MFRKTIRTLGLLLAALLPVSLQAQQSLSAQCSDPSQSLLWKVESPRLSEQQAEIYLFGSIHLGKASFYPLHPTIEAAHRQADYLVFEVDPQSAASPAAAMDLQMRGLLPRGQSLDQQISPQTLEKLEQVLKSLGIPLANMLPFKPWMVSLLLTNMQAASIGMNPLDGLEYYFLSHKPAATGILELESLEQQLSMLENLDAEVFLSYTLEDFSRASEILDTMMQAWLCADKQTLYESVSMSDEMLAAASSEDKALLEHFYDSMFTHRNVIMADGVEVLPEHGAGRYFVVVGSGHLLGEGSVVDLLQQRGYQVEPVLLD